MFSLKLTAIAAGVALLIGTASGWKVRDAFCDAAEQRQIAATYAARVKALEDNIRRIAEVAAEDSKRAAEYAAQVEALEKEIEDGRQNIGDRECFSPDDVERLRKLWQR